MKSMVRPGAAIVCLLVATLPLPSAAADEVETKLSLSAAIESALKKNEGLLVARESVVAADEAARGARGPYDPLLTVDGTWERATPPVNSAFSGAPAGELAPTTKTVSSNASVTQLLPTGGEVAVRASAGRISTDGAFSLLSPSYETSLGVEFRQPLLRGLKSDGARLGIRVAAADRTLAGASLRREVTETVAAVERAYWALVEAREAVGVREEAVRLAEEQLSQTKIRIEQGASPETEEAQPRAELQRRKGDLFAGHEDLSRAENALKLLILSDGDAPTWARPIVPTDSPEVQKVDVDLVAEMDRALASRPELEEAEATRQRRRAESEFAKSDARPGLDAVVSYDRYGLAGSLNPNGSSLSGTPPQVSDRLLGSLGRSYRVLADGDFDNARVGVVFSLPIGNRAARAAARSAESAERQSDAELARARKSVRAEVLDAAASVRTAYERFEAAVAQREAAEVQLSAERDRYSAGLSTNFLVLTRQNDLARARLDEITARTDYRVARTELSRATGSLLADRGIEAEGGQTP